ncbi:hypothetical protein IV203_017912 [Nitzschia inconspicua]|uniref:Uncharacterized protein n=1 Tax=Nitzschia inconspicua TaxID=303405 RepID=A0A9K3Q602_9STRA|nr:hypothetical protein IV203_017912 [Nitzschia inconspicua]
MVFAIFRRSQSTHAKLKEEKISFVHQRSKESSENGRSHHESIFNIQPDIFEDVSEEREEEWTADFSKNLDKRENTAGSEAESQNDSAIALLASHPKKADDVVARTTSSKPTPTENKDAIIESLKQKCKTLRDTILQYGDIDNYSESETAMALEREKYRLKKELKVVKSQLKFTNTALEDAVQKIQNQSLEKATLAETIDNQSDQIHDFKVKCELLEKEVRELKRRLQKYEDEGSTKENDEPPADTIAHIAVSSSSSKGENASSSSEASSGEDQNKNSKNQRQIILNPFDDESTTSTYRSPFDDDLSSHSKSLSQKNPFENVENVNTGNQQDDEAEEAMQTKLAEIQAKYAERMAWQLSRIAALQEENDIKDIQLKNLQERLETQQQDYSSHKRMFGKWMRNDAKSNRAEAEVRLPSV